MTTRRENGFTIIETSLVLAITGLIIAIVLVNISSALNQQRYTDAVNQTVDFLRGQYTQTTSTLNNRSPDEKCDSGGIQEGSSGTSMKIGASECLLLGRIIRSSNGQDMKVAQVLALHDPSDDVGVDKLSDADLLAASQLSEGNNVDTYKVEWSAQLVSPSTNNPAAFTIMVVRTPVSGTIRTYTSSSDTVPIAQLLDSGISPQQDMTMCINQSGFFVTTASSVGVRIVKGAANTTGVEVLPAGECT